MHIISLFIHNKTLTGGALYKWWCNVHPGESSCLLWPLQPKLQQCWYWWSNFMPLNAHYHFIVPVDYSCILICP